MWQSLLGWWLSCGGEAAASSKAAVRQQLLAAKARRLFTRHIMPLGLVSKLETVLLRRAACVYMCVVRHSGGCTWFPSQSGRSRLATHMTHTPAVRVCARVCVSVSMCHGSFSNTSHLLSPSNTPSCHSYYYCRPQQQGEAHSHMRASVRRLSSGCAPAYCCGQQLLVQCSGLLHAPQHQQGALPAPGGVQGGLQ